MLKEKINNNNSEELIEVLHLPVEIENGKTYVINQPNPNSYTHSYFKYPCKFIPELPRWALNKYITKSNENVLDPFSGSGTTLLEANLKGLNAYGTEIDSFAKLLIKVKTTLLDIPEINYIKKWIKNLISSYKDSFKDYEDPFVPQINNLYHWFPEENVQKLGLIKKEISKVENQRIADFLKVCLASSVRKCSYADDVSPKPYVSKKIKKVPSDPFIIYPTVVEKYLQLMNEFVMHSRTNSIGNTELLNGDALNINTDLKFNIAITSPPYINAFDYVRTLRLENLWLNLESEDTLRRKKKDYVGTENIKVKIEEEDLSILKLSDELRDIYYRIEAVDKKRAVIVKKFFEDMRQNLLEVKDVLVDGGKYCIVIGDSTIRKVHVKSWKIISDIAISEGYELDTYFSYIIQNHYLRIPRGKRGGKINKDYVFVLKKSN